MAHYSNACPVDFFDMRALIILVTSLTSPALAQTYQRSSQDAAILSDARYLAGDGTFGAAYTQEDGVEFKEESDVNGDRKGSYSYVDPTGHRRTVFYTAGKNGFQATGDHIPTAPPVVAPQPEYEPLPEYNPPDYRPPYQAQRQQYSSQAQPHSHYAQESIYQPQSEPSYYHRPQYRPPAPPSTPPHPQYRPETQQHNRPLLALQHEPADAQPPASFRYHNGPRYEPRGSQYESHALPRPRYNDLTTPAPRRFHPPGKLDFNRTPDGFSYTFSKS